VGVDRHVQLQGSFFVTIAMETVVLVVVVVVMATVPAIATVYAGVFPFLSTLACITTMLAPSIACFL
jgi:hypothetical protein